VTPDKTGLTKFLRGLLSEIFCALSEDSKMKPGVSGWRLSKTSFNPEFHFQRLAPINPEVLTFKPGFSFCDYT